MLVTEKEWHSAKSKRIKENGLPAKMLRRQAVHDEGRFPGPGFRKTLPQTKMNLNFFIPGVPFP